MAKAYKRSSSKEWLKKAVAKNTRRPALTSIYREYEWAIAADGYQLMIDFNPDSSITNETGPYIPVHAESCERDYHVHKYPDILSIIPKRLTHSYVTVHADKLRDALKLAAVFAKLNANSVKLSWSQTAPGLPGYLRVHGKAIATGEAMTELEAACSVNYVPFDDSGLTVHLDYKYLLNALSGMRHAHDRLVTLSVQGPNYPVMLWPGEVIHVPSFSPRDGITAGDRVALIMPMSH